MSDTPTRGRRIARNSLFLAVAHGSSKIFSIGLTAIAGRVLGASGYGLYTIGATLVEVGRVVASSGLDYLVAREVASEPESASRVATNASVVKVITGLVTYAVLLALVILLDYPPAVLSVVLVLGTALFFENSSDILDAVFHGRERMEFTTRTLVTSSAVIFLSGAAALLGGLGLMGYCWAMVLGFVVRWCLLTFFARRVNFARLTAEVVEKEQVSRLFRAAAPLFGATVVALLFHRVDLLMLGRMVSQEEVGLYGAAVRIIDVVVLAPRILATAVFPALRKAREGDDAIATSTLAAESLRLTLLVCSLLALGVWATATFALRWIPGPEYVPADGALRLLAWGVVLQGGSHVLARLLFAIDREVDFLRIGGISLLTNITLNVWWISRWGIEGAAAATLVSYAVNVALYLAFAHRRGFRVSIRALIGPIFALGSGAVVALMTLHRGSAQAALYAGLTWLIVAIGVRALHRGDVRRAGAIFRG